MYAFKTLAKNNFSTKGGNIEWYPPQNGVPGIWMSEAPKTHDRYYLCTKENVIYWLDEQTGLGVGPQQLSIITENNSTFISKKHPIFCFLGLKTSI